MGESTEHLNEETRSAWDANASYWDQRIGEGNDFQEQLINPATERLLAPRAGETLLDAGCGNGSWSRRLAAIGVQVVAFDFSRSMIEHARARSAAHTNRIEYHVLDATDEAGLRALGEHRFDGAVSNMTLMDMARIEPLAAALASLLKPGGRFVFSVSHPCFNTTGTSTLAEEGTEDGRLVLTRSVRVTRYLGLEPARGIAIAGQPEPQWYFDRPLHALFRVFFRAGFVLDGLEEPAFSVEEGRSPLSWRDNAEIPPALVVRLRPS